MKSKCYFYWSLIRLVAQTELSDDLTVNVHIRSFWNIVGSESGANVFDFVKCNFL